MMKKGFLKYLDDIEENQEKQFEEIHHQKEKVIPSQKKEDDNEIEEVLSINTKINSVEKAKLVIEKLQNWISKQNIDNNHSSFKIPKKRVIGGKVNKVVETVNHASNILDGLPEEIKISEDRLNINFIPQQKQDNFETVAGHASALL